RLAARCQVLDQGADDAPETVLDVAHNRDAAIELAAFLSRRPRAARTHAVFGALVDKPVGDLFAALRNSVDHWHLADIVDARGQSARALRDQLPLADADATLHPSPAAAYRAARAAAKAGDRVVVFGSFHTVGAILAELERDRRSDP
ncbi:MAG: glutamate ligase domain-containing protein, partial [bacterium]